MRSLISSTQEVTWRDVTQTDRKEAKGRRKGWIKTDCAKLVNVALNVHRNHKAY